MKIEIGDQILSGNLGDGWVSNNDAADAYAEWLSGRYESEARAMFPGAEIEIDVEVQHNASGSARNVSVWIHGADCETERDLQTVLENTDYWSEWCESDDAAAYIGD